MIKRALITSISVIAIAVSASVATAAHACPYGDDWDGDYGWNGRGMMGGYGYGMGPGMMGPGGWTGPGMMRRQNPQQANLNLSARDVKSYLEQWIASGGNPSIKVGSVVETDDSTITAEIVTKQNTLVQKFAFDRHSGFYRPIQ